MSVAGIMLLPLCAAVAGLTLRVAYLTRESAVRPPSRHDGHEFFCRSYASSGADFGGPGRLDPQGVLQRVRAIWEGLRRPGLVREGHESL
eukprot:15443315-Alexandrium_andersonii.AAC.1